MKAKVDCREDSVVMIGTLDAVHHREQVNYTDALKHPGSVQWRSVCYAYKKDVKSSQR